MNNMWKRIFILLSGYLSIIAFAVLGGLVWYKNNEDEKVKKTVKLTLIITLIFTAISALLGLYNYIGSLWSHYYSTNAYEAYGILSSLVSIAKIIVYAIFIIKVFVDNKQNEEVTINNKSNNGAKSQFTSKSEKSVVVDEDDDEFSDNLNNKNFNN